MELHKLILEVARKAGWFCRISFTEDDDCGGEFVYVQVTKRNWPQDDLDESLIVNNRQSTVCCRSCKSPHSDQCVEVDMHQPNSMDIVLGFLKCKRCPSTCEFVQKDGVRISFQLIKKENGSVSIYRDF